MRSVPLTLAIALAASLLLLAGACSARKSDPQSVEWVCKHETTRVKRLFDSLDYLRPGLQPVQVAVAARDYPRACRALIDYYRNADTAASLRLKPVAATGGRDANSDSLLADKLVVYGTQAKITRKHGGGIDWKSRGPKDDPEWNHALNGHFQFDTLLRGYRKTGRSDYLRKIDADTRDWILSNPVPDEMIGDGPWQGMMTASRMRNWMETFYGLQNTNELAPATRILMLSSILDHADYLQRFHHTDFTNRCIGEMRGLAIIGCAWPEFKLASTWRSYAVSEMAAQMKGQVYPDGVHTELTAGYHRVVTEQFDGFIDVFHQFGYDVPPTFGQGVERMWDYLAMSARPDGTTPENNDTDRRDIREKLNNAAQKYNRSDWVYVTSNGGSGDVPKEGPSIMFPWAGQLIMRSTWKNDAQWAFFDVGPEGTSHWHRDKLHLSVDAFGRALLVDAGRYSYANDAWHVYFTGTQAHNTILIDGQGQQTEELRATAPVSPDDFMITPQFDFARGTFTAGYDGVPGNVTHTRAVCYVKNQFWIVVDRIETDAPHQLDALWHFAPDCHVRIDGHDVVSDDNGKANLRVIPIGGPPWTTTLVSGQSAPIQGWYSLVFGSKQPESCAVFHARVPRSTTFAWALVPARGNVPPMSTQLVLNDQNRVKVIAGRYTITIPVTEGKPEIATRASR